MLVDLCNMLPSNLWLMTAIPSGSSSLKTKAGLYFPSRLIPKYGSIFSRGSDRSKAPRLSTSVAEKMSICVNLRSNCRFCNYFKQGIKKKLNY